MAPQSAASRPVYVPLAPSSSSSTPVMSCLAKRRLAEANSDCNAFSEPWLCCKRLKCSDVADKICKICQRRRFLLMSRVERKNSLQAMIQPDGTFVFNSHRVCYFFLINALSFSNSLIASVKQSPASRAPSALTFTPREGPADSRKFEVSVFLRRLSETIGGVMPDSSEVHLPYHHKKEVYNEYKNAYLKDRASGSTFPPISSSYFHRVWKELASTVKVRKHHRFTKCDDCERYRSRLAAAGLKEVRAKKIMEAKSKHIAFVTREREEYAVKRNSASRQPSKFSSIIIDGADQSAYGIPHFVYNTKDLRGESMKVRLVDVKEHFQIPNIYVYLLTQEYKSDSNHTIEILHRFIIVKSRSGPLPPVFYVQMDNCTRENKNRFVFGYFELLIAMGVFLEIHVSFLPLGHTHEDVDQVFSRTSLRLRTTEALKIPQLAEEIATSYTPRPVVTEIRQVANVRDLFLNSGALFQRNSWTDMRYFKLYRGAGEPRNEIEHFRTACSAKLNAVDDWEPFDTGIPFLRFVPDLAGTPPNIIETPPHKESVNSRLETSSTRIGNASTKYELYEMRDRVFRAREEHFHWPLSSTIECNGHFLACESPPVPLSDDEADNAIHTDHLADGFDHSYSTGDMVAIRTAASSDAQPDCSVFWIGEVRKARKNSSGQVTDLTLRRYEASGVHQQFPYKAIYYPSVKTVKRGRTAKRVPWMDDVSAQSVCVKFDALKKDHTLKSYTAKKIQQSLQSM